MSSSAYDSGCSDILVQYNRYRPLIIYNYLCNEPFSVEAYTARVKMAQERGDQMKAGRYERQLKVCFQY